MLKSSKDTMSEKSEELANLIYEQELDDSTYQKPEAHVAFSLDRRLDMSFGEGRTFLDLFDQDEAFLGYAMDSRHGAKGCALHGHKYQKPDKGRATFRCLQCERDSHGRMRRRRGQPVRLVGPQCDCDPSNWVTTDTPSRSRTWCKVCRNRKARERMRRRKERLNAESRGQ
jgi:hypothetical protein